MPSFSGDSIETFLYLSYYPDIVIVNDSEPILGIFEQITALADDLRSRLLRLLEGRELTVTELCDVLQSPQSTISRHLKVLSSSGWVEARREGTSRLYRRTALDAELEPVWSLVRERLEPSPAARVDQRRLQAVLRQRGDRSRAFFHESADRWDTLRDDLFGTNFRHQALLGLLDADWTVADLGCGTGEWTTTLAERTARVIAVDENPEMLDVARRRAGDNDRILWRSGSLESLPIEDKSLDLACLMLVLHHLAEPVGVLREIARTLKPGGRLLLVDMLPHDDESYRDKMGHVRLGFDSETLQTFCREAGLSCDRVDALPRDPAARGPSLFSAVARRVV